MVLLGICGDCQYGNHDDHRRVIQAAPEGMLGGSACRCEGECTDGRYIPQQFKALKAAFARGEDIRPPRRR